VHDLNPLSQGHNHAAAEGLQKKLERVSRCISRSVVSEKSLSLTSWEILTAYGIKRAFARIW